MSSAYANPLHAHLNQEPVFIPLEDPDSLSPPSAHHLETPGASTSNLSNYQASDISDLEDDPFFGADFSSAEGGVPSFLQSENPGWDTSPFSISNRSSAASEAFRHAVESTYPLTPEQSASIRPPSPHSDRRPTVTRHISETLPKSISPQQLQKPFPTIMTQSSQLTPDQSSSGRSSEDGLAPGNFDTRAASPRISVSFFDHEANGIARTVVERSLHESPTALHGGFQAAGDLITSSRNDDAQPFTSRDEMGRWQRDLRTGQAGLDPLSRPADELPVSMNELANMQKVDERNQDVNRWLSDNDRPIAGEPLIEDPQNIQTIDQSRDYQDDGIPLGDNTENRAVPGQTYYAGEGGKINEQDVEIIASNRNWADAPILPHIRRETPGRHQPQTSQAAIERFELLCRDNDSILSRSATWGTRRRSIHSVADLDEEGILSGNFLRKLTISRGGDRGTDLGNRAGSLLKDLRGFVRRPSVSSLRKGRRGSASGEELANRDQEERPSMEKRDSVGSPHLSLPDRSPSWTVKNKPALSLVASFMGNSPQHARKNSTGGVPSASPRSSFSGLKVSNSLKRPRSRSELPQPVAGTGRMESHPNLISLWKTQGGPPVAALSTPNLASAHAASLANMENDDDEDDDDDLYEDSDMRVDANIIDTVEPKFQGFQEYILKLNPALDGQYNYLVDRLAQHQVIRYKALLNSKVKHLGQGAHCPCGSLCMAMGGQANILEPKDKDKAGSRWMEASSSQLLDDDGNGTPTDGAVNQDSFPQDIPLPPTQYLPAEFECQLCFNKKKFNKPSDWTKHVHEDVQPFTCTWDRCRDAKSFKRKADWVRHENEGHRHLEWWTCDVDECRHTCYRRDNFLQHLVREHKFPEPKVKTKAAIKKAGNNDATWQKVEQCHELTPKRPQEEPCRFCGKTFTTWKKLTVHLAKHMEQISLPVLRLVAAKAKEVSADTIISPVQDMPVCRLPVTQPPPVSGALMSDHGRPYLPVQHNPMVFAQPQGGYMYHPMVGPQVYAGQYPDMGTQLQQPSVGVDTMNQGFNPGPQISETPVTTPPFGQATGQYHHNGNDGGLEPFPQLDALGLHSTTGGPIHNQVGYSPMMDPSVTNVNSFSGHGTASPYSHSPHLNATKPENEWDNKPIW